MLTNQTFELQKKLNFVLELFLKTFWHFFQLIINIVYKMASIYKHTPHKFMNSQVFEQNEIIIKRCWTHQSTQDICVILNYICTLFNCLWNGARRIVSLWKIWVIWILKKYMIFHIFIFSLITSTYKFNMI